MLPVKSLFAQNGVFVTFYFASTDFDKLFILTASRISKKYPDFGSYTSSMLFSSLVLSGPSDVKLSNYEVAGRVKLTLLLFPARLWFQTQLNFIGLVTSLAKPKAKTVKHRSKKTVLNYYSLFECIIVGFKLGFDRRSAFAMKLYCCYGNVCNQNDCFSRIPIKIVFIYPSTQLFPTFSHFCHHEGNPERSATLTIVPSTTML